MLDSLARHVLDRLLEGCQIIGFDWKYLYVNDVVAEQGRRAKEELLGRTMTEAYPGIENTPMFSVLRRCMEERTARSMENEFTFPDGSNGWFDLRCEPVPEGLVILSLDVTEQKRAASRIGRLHAVSPGIRDVNQVITGERTLASVRCLGQRLERLTGVIQDLSRVRSLGGITEIVRRAARDLAGSDGATFVLRDGDQCWYVDEDAIAPLWKGRRFALGKCISGWVMIHREPAVIEDVYADPRIPHEAYRPTFVKSLAMVPVRSAAPVGAIGNYWARPHRVSDEDLGILQALADSTSVALENVRAYASLEESEARTKAIYDHLPSPTFVWQLRGEDFVLTTVNEAARAMTKAGAADLLGRSPADIPHGFPDLGRDLERCLRERVTVRRELSHAFSPSHQPRQVVATYGFVPPDMVLVHTDDVTEQRRTEEQLRLAQRMEAIGRLAGGVAHDFGNLLSVITSYAELALDGVRGIDPLHADIREIRKAAERATLLTRQLLAFGRKQLLSPRVLDLNQVVAEMEGMLRRLLGEDIDFATGLAPDLGRVKADPGQIEQVVMNLAVNARDAMPGGGKLTIDTTNVELDELYAGQHVSVKPGAYVLLSVSDTGCGMDDQIRTRLFEPFFTTKETGKGTGLGLATVYGIVKQSGGNIWVYSEPGKGTTFKVYLPREPAEATVETRLSRAVPRVTGDETILVVEDDEAVRNLARRVLASAGYTVVTAANGGEALLTCERYPGRIHLMLTDVVMPEMSGKDVAQRVAKLLPELRVLYMSGYTDRAIVHRGVLESGTHFVSKPFNAADLTGAVRAVLDEVLSEVAASAGTQSG